MVVPQDSINIHDLLHVFIMRVSCTHLKFYNETLLCIKNSCHCLSPPIRKVCLLFKLLKSDLSVIVSCWYLMTFGILLNIDPKTVGAWQQNKATALTNADITAHSYDTVETLYNTINFCWNTHKRHSIARPKGRGMGCLLWVQMATYCVDLSILSSIKYLL